MLVAKSNLPFFLLAVKTSFQGIDRSFVLIQGICYIFYLRSPLFDRVSTLPNAIFKGLTFFACLELHKGLLLVNRFTLLFDCPIELLLAADVIFIGTQGGNTAGIFGLLFQSRRRVAQTTSNQRPSLFFLYLFKGVRILRHLPLNSLDVLLCLSVLHSDARENLPHFS